MRREGRHACRVWSCVLRLCVLERIFLQLKTCLILPPTPPVPCHHNKESESSSGQEGIRADTSINMGPQVPCTALPTGSSTSLPVLHSTCSKAKSLSSVYQTCAAVTGCGCKHFTLQGSRLRSLIKFLHKQIWDLNFTRPLLLSEGAAAPD